MPALIVLLAIAFGSTLIVFGRHRYKTPSKGYPTWAVNDPEHPFVKGYERFHLKFSRFSAVFYIFVGAFAILASLMYWLGAFWPVIALPIAIIATATLRPKLPTECSAETGPTSVPAVPRPKQGLLSKKGKLALAGVFILALTFFVGINTVIRNSEPSRLAFQRAGSNPQVRRQLGEPVKAGLFISGSIETSGPSGHADLSIPLSGPKGKGKLYVTATEKAGLWHFETLEVAVDGDPNRINLLSEADNPTNPNRN